MVWFAVAAGAAMCATNGCSSRIDQARFEGVYRAGKALAGATDVGVVLLRYRELLATFASEVSIASDKANSKSEREMVRLYLDALRAYKDVETLWAAQFAPGQSGTVGATDGPEFKRMLDDYQITNEGTVDNPRLNLKAAMQVVWVTARAKLDGANRIYNNLD